MNKDPIWETAMDWLLRLNAEPHNRELHDQCDQWQAQAHEHAQAWRKVERVWQLSAQLHPTQVTPALPKTARLSTRRRLVILASTMAASLILSLYLSLNHSEIRTGAAEVRIVHLNDGSRITLDGNSAIEWSFQATERQVHLKYGNAFFEVARDTNRPFIVTSDSARIEVLGTAFNLANDKSHLSLSVAHGSVSLSDSTLKHPQLNTPLLPGERVRIQHSSQILLRDSVSPSHIAAWRDGMLLAQDDRLDLLLAQIERHYAGVIILTDEQLAQQRVTGAFHLDQPINALQALVTPFGGQLHQISPLLIVISH